MNPKELADRYLAAADQIAAHNDLEMLFLRQLLEDARTAQAMNNRSLLPLIENLQDKWVQIKYLVSKSYAPGILPVNPEGFLQLVKGFYPCAYAKYREAHP